MSAWTDRLIIAVWLAIACGPTFAEEGVEVMRKVLHTAYYQGSDVRAQARMKIVDSQGRERIRELTLLRRNTEPGDGEQKYYVYFYEPSDVKKMVFMAWKHVNKDDDRWLYLPALDLVRRIAASDERASFVGSHFFYEDVSGRGLDEDAHTLTSEDDAYYHISSKPNNPGAVEFSRYDVVVDKQTALPITIEYYDRDGSPYRRYTTLESKKIDGYMTVTKSQMENLQTAERTIVDYSSIRYSQGVPESIFSERYLRRAPKEYLN